MPDERPLSALQLSQLAANLNPARVVKMKKGGRGPELSYVEAWEIRTNLIRIFGYGGFGEHAECQVVRVDEVENRTSGGKQFRATVMAHVTVVIPQLGVSYREAAVSSQSNPDPGEALDFATKTAESDAFKRACINLGTQFGLSLYNQGATLDVVKVVREPRQAAILKALSEGRKPSEIDAEHAAHAVNIEEPDDERSGLPSPEEWSPEVVEAAQAARAPQRATVATPGGHVDQEGDWRPAPGEDPRDDLPMVLDGDGSPAQPETRPASPAARADAMANVKRGFDRRN